MSARPGARPLNVTAHGDNVLDRRPEECGLQERVALDGWKPSSLAYLP
jgi:hypothetical protein